MGGRRHTGPLRCRVSQNLPDSPVAAKYSASSTPPVHPSGVSASVARDRSWRRRTPAKLDFRGWSWPIVPARGCGSLSTDPVTTSTSKAMRSALYRAIPARWVDSFGRFSKRLSSTPWTDCRSAGSDIAASRRVTRIRARVIRRDGERHSPAIGRRVSPAPAPLAPSRPARKR